jgi:DNA invertase Pin-like site-specific DNA recombinase
MRKEMVNEAHIPITDLGPGMDIERPGLKEVQKLARRGSIDYLYISSIDRLARDTFKVLQLVRSLTESGVVVKTVDDTATAFGGFNPGGKCAH